MARTIQVVIDCADPAGLAPFWAQLLGYKLQDPPAGYDSWEAFLAAQGIPEDQWNSASAIVDPDGRGPRIFFQRVPEPKAVKNRVHLDVNVGGGHATPFEERRRRVDEAVERAIGLGATKLRAYEQRGEYWVVMQDPEGNEFCLQ
ncbi:MAG: glyoxalase [Herpetosiphonaceae bacterium]|nr:MAG: glyoxalase [Herpetosiphonaceae bacterium]